MMDKEELLKQQREEFERAKKEYGNKLKTVEEGSARDLLVDAKEEQVDWIIYTGVDGIPKKYEIVTVQIPYEEYLKVTMDAWKKANGDKNLFSLLFQVEHMKRTWKKIGGIPVDDMFWHRVNPQFVDTIREQMYGPIDLYASGDSELLKNLIPQLLQSLPNILPGLKQAIQSTQNSLPEEAPSTPTPMIQS